MKKNKTGGNIVISNITFNQFGNYAAEFLQSLVDQGYSTGTIGHYRCFINVLADKMYSKGISLQELDESLAVTLAAQTGWKKERVSNNCVTDVLS